MESENIKLDFGPYVSVDERYRAFMQTLRTNDNINIRNGRGENALHLATVCVVDEPERELRNLIEAGVDVNAQNISGQAPLHYAARMVDPNPIETLMQSSSIQVGIRDINGYNVLHILLASWLKRGTKAEVCLKLLCNSGIDFNQQTKDGHSIVHLAISISTKCFRMVLSHCKGILVDVTNKYGENIFHIWMDPIDIFRNYPNLREKYALLEDVLDGRYESFPSELIGKLLNAKDVNGNSPLMLCLKKEDCYVFDYPSIEELVSKIVTYSSSSAICNNLGNTCLHYGCRNNLSERAFKTLLSSGADRTQVNLFGQTPAHILCVCICSPEYVPGIGAESREDLKRKTVEYLLSDEFDFNTKDKWGCTPLMNLAASCIDCQFQNAYGFQNHSIVVWEILVQHGDLNVNIMDNYGASALHYATIHDNEIAVRALLQLGARCDLSDALGDDPLKTARRHKSVNCEKELLSFLGAEKVYDRMETFVVGLDNLKANFSTGSPCSWIDVDIDEFLNNLLSEMRTHKSLESEKLKTSVKCLVGLICHYVSEYDDRFTMHAIPVGSAAEGTKLGEPDEFDFVLCLDRISQMTSIMERTNFQGERYASIQFKELPVPDDLLQFTNCRGIIMPQLFYGYLNRYIDMALNNLCVWANDELQMLCPGKRCLTRHRTKNIFCLNLIWMGCEYKRLNISVDLAPAVYSPDPWPPSLEVTTPIGGDKLKQMGFVVLLDAEKTVGPSFSFYENAMFSDYIDSISEEYDHNSTLNASSVLTEVLYMKHLPDKIRDSYILAKVVNEINNEDKVPSYVLKNGLFYAVDDLLSDITVSPELCLENTTLRNLTLTIFERILTHYNKSLETMPYSFRGTVPLYFQRNRYLLVTDKRIKNITKIISLLQAQ